MNIDVANSKIKNKDPLLKLNLNADLWGKDYLNNIYDFIARRIEPPFAISIDGDWGAGKTTVMLHLKEKLQKDGFPVFWFNPWEYKDPKSIVLCFLKKLVHSFPSELAKKENEKWEFLQLLCIAGLETTARILSLGIVSPIEITKELEDIAKKDRPKWKTTKDIIEELRNEFVGIVNLIAASKKPLVIFLDDFDRCLPDDTIRLLEAIKNLFLAVDKTGKKANVIFICGINTQIARHFIKKHYNLNENNDDATSYFRKIFNITIAVPWPENIEVLLKEAFLELQLQENENKSDYIQCIIDCGNKFNLKSIRKYLNVIHNFYLGSILRPNLNPTEKKWLLKLCIYKEISYELHESLRHVSLNSAKGIEQLGAFKSTTLNPFYNQINDSLRKEGDEFLVEISNYGQSAILSALFT